MFKQNYILYIILAQYVYASQIHGSVSVIFRYKLAYESAQDYVAKIVKLNCQIVKFLPLTNIYLSYNSSIYFPKHHFYILKR